VSRVLSLVAVGLAAAWVVPVADAVAGSPRLIASDTAQSPDPIPFWGAVECEDPSRHQLVATGGDPHPTITGAPQGDSSYRRITLLDGDDFFGERCELGLDFRRGPTAFYREGQRRITAISLRLTPTLQINAPNWRVVSQIKQTQPSANGGGSPMIELQVFLGQWKLIRSRGRGFTNSSRQLWSAPAQIGTWTRFLFDVRYSKRKRQGFVSVHADLNGDHDTDDPGETSRRIRTFTLKTEVRGGDRDGLKPGRSIPSHLRSGLYQDPAISCPPPGGCQLDLDNVQVLDP
jgi:hypothetical protein